MDTDRRELGLVLFECYTITKLSKYNSEHCSTEWNETNKYLKVGKENINSSYFLVAGAHAKK